LPTREWSPVCDQLTAGLGPGDELLVVCDAPTDPVADHDPPDGVDVLVAGSPERCSGKANALAVGMERATNDRFVWTDDDFEREPEWLDELVVASIRDGPATVFPDFVGGGWWRLAEPALVILLGARALLGRRESGFPWGGGVAFHRDHLSVSVDELVALLRTCLSDDLVLHEHLDACTTVSSLDATVHVDGDARSVANRLVRYMRSDHVHEGLVGEFVVSVPVAALGLAAPLPVAAVTTALLAVGYLAGGRPPWNALFAYPALLSLPVLIGTGLVVDEVAWGGRRYVVRDAYDVEVVDQP
jgi:hypothetical protein